MSPKRPPAPPPELPGFDYVSVLGSGGFADVYLYEQRLPRRRVAVKVLLPEQMAAGTAEQFTAEANVMAMLSTHPAIVTIYQAGVSDDGRPYLVMEYCSRPNLQVRSKAAPFSVAEALRVGIQVAAAVETAHRAGILHRDIKPANILVTEYNRPALTDFGIATSAHEEQEDSAAGMSIPWSPPESFSDDPVSSVATDVYALGATIYTLLASRSPFEYVGVRNTGAELMRRIESEPLPPLSRADVPASLFATLERAMAKQPAARFESAVAFARSLQRVQIELAHSVTPIDILDDSPEVELEEHGDDELTRVRGIVSIDPNTSPAAGTTRPRFSYAEPEPEPLEEATRARPTVIGQPETYQTPVEPDVSALASVGPAAGPPPAVLNAAPLAPPERPRSSRRLVIGLIVGGVALVVIAGVVIASMFAGSSPKEPAASPSTSSNPQDVTVGIVPMPTDVSGTVTGDSVTFTWKNPEPAEGDSYIWYPVTLDGGNGANAATKETTATVPKAASGATCIEVLLVRANAASSKPVRECVE